MVLQYAEGGDFYNWMNKNCKDFKWNIRMLTLERISSGLYEIHQKNLMHRDFHTGNILFLHRNMQHIYTLVVVAVLISDMGLCKEVGNIDKSNIYGVMPYVAPEVLKGKPYTQAADVYSFGMIMYFTATGRQPFADRAHDFYLAKDICKGVRPEINEQVATKSYIDLMKKCWDSNPDNRPNATEIKELFECSEFIRQFQEAEEYREKHLLSIENNQSTTHPQAIYTSRLLNLFVKDLPKYGNSECYDWFFYFNYIST
jgi:serine/threonine protein kinase